MSALLEYDVTLDLREAELTRRETVLRREMFDLSAQFAARERELLAERDRLVQALEEATHRLRRAEMIGATLRR